MKMASNSIKRFALLLQTIVLIFLSTSCADDAEVLRTNDHEPSSNQMKKINLSQNGYATLSLLPGGESIQLAADVVNELDEGQLGPSHVHISFRKVNYSNGGNHTPNVESGSVDVIKRFGVGAPKNIILEGRIGEGVAQSTGQKKIRYVLPIASSSTTISSLPDQDPDAGTPNLVLSSYYDLTQSSPFNYKGFPTGKYFAEIYSWYNGYQTGVISAYNVSTNYLHIGSYSLAKSVVGSGTVTSSGNEAPGGGQLPEESVTLTAIPNSNWEFVEWSGGASGTNNPTSITMDGNKSVTATFRLITRFSIATVVNPSGAGYIIQVPQPGSDGLYYENTNVEVRAFANNPRLDYYGDPIDYYGSTYSFSHWSGDISSTIWNPTVTMNSNKSVVANYLPSLTVNGVEVLAGSSTYTVANPTSGYTYKWYKRDVASNHLFVYKSTGTSRSETIGQSTYFELKVEAYNASNTLVQVGYKKVYGDFQ